MSTWARGPPPTNGLIILISLTWGPKPAQTACFVQLKQIDIHTLTSLQLDCPGNSASRCDQCWIDRTPQYGQLKASFLNSGGTCSPSRANGWTPCGSGVSGPVMHRV